MISYRQADFQDYIKESQIILNFFFVDGTETYNGEEGDSRWKWVVLQEPDNWDGFKHKEELMKAFTEGYWEAEKFENDWFLSWDILSKSENEAEKGFADMLKRINNITDTEVLSNNMENWGKEDGTYPIYSMKLNIK